MMKREGEKTVKERLLVHGLRIFAEHGYEGGTVREICDAAGSNIAAINYYYGGKRGLYDAVKQYAWNLRRTAFDGTWVLAQTDPWGALRMRVEVMLDSTYDDTMFQVHRLFMRELMADDGHEDMEELRKHDERRVVYENRMKDLLARLLGEASTPANIRLLRYTFYSLCLFLPIQTTIENKFIKGDAMFNVTRDMNKTQLAEFIMNMVRMTVADMKSKVSASNSEVRP